VSKDKKRWLPVKNDYLFNQEALSQVFRGKFMQRLRRARNTSALKFADATYSNFKNMLYSKNWVVSVRDPVKRPEHVLQYLARYTHRVAIANSRIKKLENGMVSFTAKNRKKKNTETITITAVEFIRRFFLHSLPKTFVRIRHYGFLANRNRSTNLKIIRELLKLPTQVAKMQAPLEQMMLHITGIDITACPCCSKGEMKLLALIPMRRARAPNNRAAVAA
jgi:hypothetical protein